MFITRSYSEKTIKMWSVNSNNSLYTFSNFSSGIGTIGIFDKQDIIVCCLYDNNFHLIDLKTKQIIKTSKIKNIYWIMKTYNDAKYDILTTDNKSKLLIFNF